MSILDIKKLVLKYMVLAVFVLIFGQVYEYFSFGVVSNYMVYAFLIPLILGLITIPILYFSKLTPSKVSSSLYRNGIITLTVGSILKGIFDIYGTTNAYLWVYLYIGVAFILLGMITFFSKIGNH